MERSVPGRVRVRARGAWDKPSVPAVSLRVSDPRCMRTCSAQVVTLTSLASERNFAGEHAHMTCSKTQIDTHTHTVKRYITHVMITACRMRYCANPRCQCSAWISAVSVRASGGRRLKPLPWHRSQRRSSLLPSPQRLSGRVILTRTLHLRAPCDVAVRVGPDARQKMTRQLRHPMA